MTVEPSNFPAGRKLGDKVRELGTRLYADAKRSSEAVTTCRTHSLGVTPHGSVETYLREDVHATHEDHR